MLLDIHIEKYLLKLHKRLEAKVNRANIYH